ncbi:MAG: hypothetical protein WKG07_13080 [Hymenobacter sp.]
MFAGLNNPGTVGVATFPSVYPRLALAIGLSTTTAKLPIEITFRTDAGKDVVPPFTGTFEIQRPTGTGKEEAANVNFNLNFDAFQLEGPGKLFISIDSEKDELAELELNVVKSEPPTSTPEA